MKKFILVCLFFYSNNILALGVMELGIFNKRNGIMVYLLNTTLEGIFVNKRMSIGPVNGPNELILVIKDADDKEFPFVSKVRIAPALKSDYETLSPNMFLGRYLSNEQLSRYYGLPPGEYQIKAIYKDSSLAKDNAFDGVIESKYMIIVVN